MTLQQLKYIVEISNCGSMREASAKLFVSQPSLSVSVKELEEELGFSIFHRSNKGISLSMAGSEFLGYARQVIEQTELLSTENHPKSILVSDRATLFNLLLGLQGYTISTGVISSDLNGENITAVPLEVEEIIRVGYITRKDVQLSDMAQRYVQLLTEYIREIP